MGRVSIQTPAAPPSAVNHFTHPHDLHPLSLYNPQTLCSGCNLQSSGIMYACTPCNFTLHQSCANLPQLITHPSHGGCNLSLLTVSTYPDGRFSCNACSLTGDSWNYHCASCEYDLHVSCASKPLKIRIQSHTSCDLHLTFKNPYQNPRGFSCDICGKIESKQWLYRCNSCEFDVHLDCTNAAPRPRSPHHNHQLMHSASSGGMNIHSYFSAPPHAVAQANSLVPQPHLMHSVSTGAIGTPYAGNLYPGPGNSGVSYGSMAGNSPVMMNNAAVHNNQPARVGGLGGNMMVAALHGFVDAFQGIGQAVVQDVIGIGGGGDGGGGGDEDSY